MTKGFIKLVRDSNIEELLKYPYAYTLLTLIALRAKRASDIGFNNLEIGECYIGDCKTIGASQRQYRTAKQRLSTCGLATFKGTNKGTIAKLTNIRVFDINLSTDRQADRQASDNQGVSNNVIDNVTLATTNKEIKNKRIKNKELLLSKDNICGKFESKKINDEFEEIWKNYIPVKTKDGGFTGKGDKKPALSEFERICKKADDNIFEEISFGVKNYLQECSQTSTRTKHFVRFLKNETWKEYQTLQNQAVICSEDKDEKRFNELMEALN